jgi:hypothetical protein
MSCINHYIGIRGECPNAKLFIDDLPGINIENAADIAEGFERPIDVINKSFSLAVDQVYNDWVNGMKEWFDYQDIYGDYGWYGSGIHMVTAPENTILEIKLVRLYNEFTLTKINKIGLYTKTPDIKTILIKDRFGDIVQEFDQEFKYGFNEILIDYISPNEEITVCINIGGMEIGSNKEYSSSSGCYTCTCSNDCISVYSNLQYGFDIKGSCIADRCAIIESFFESLKTAILYKTGINFFLHVKGSNRINAYTRNSKEQVDYFLNIWQGGVDTITGIKTSSAYWSALKVAVETTSYTLRFMKIKPFKYGGSEICNVLP